MDGRSDGVIGKLSWLPVADVRADPDGFLSEVLTGWKRQQVVSGYTMKTVARRNAAVLRMAAFVGSYPWEWLPGDADEFFAHLRGVENLALNTVRAYQGDVKLFLEYAGDPAYDWNENCGRLFGTVFSQVVTDLNRTRHVQEPAEPTVRPFSVRELQDFFDLADLEPERILRSGRRGALAAWRDAVAFKTLYAWGLRLNEMRHLILPDFSRNARRPEFHEWGVLRVRMGKAMKGSPPKQRTVLTVFDWSVDMIDHWVRVGRPRFDPEPATPLFPTETGKLLDGRNLRRKFHQLTDELGFAPGLDLHSLRRSYATNLQTVYGADTSFVQLQLGHEHASTTAIYTVAAPDYRSRHLEHLLTETLTRSGAVLPRPDLKDP